MTLLRPQSTSQSVTSPSVRIRRFLTPPLLRGIGPFPGIHPKKQFLRFLPIPRISPLSDRHVPRYILNSEFHISPILPDILSDTLQRIRRKKRTSGLSGLTKRFEVEETL